MVGYGIAPATANPKRYVKVSLHTPFHCMLLCLLRSLGYGFLYDSEHIQLWGFPLCPSRMCRTVGILQPQCCICSLPIVCISLDVLPVPILRVGERCCDRRRGMLCYTPPICNSSSSLE